MRRSVYHYGLQYFLCDRFFPARYAQAPWKQEEIVALDCALFPYREREFWPLYRLFQAEVPAGKQLIAVMEACGEEKLPALEELGFEFCGFDLVEEETEISALVNCGEWEGIPLLARQNKYGLLSAREEAQAFCRMLREKFPEEPHADCLIYAIWRIAK